MRLYLLKRMTEDEGRYDETQGVVVRAENEKQARELAATQAGDEGADTWTHFQYSTCELLRQTGKACVILRDFNAG